MPTPRVLPPDGEHTAALLFLLTCSSCARYISVYPCFFFGILMSPVPHVCAVATFLWLCFGFLALPSYQVKVKVAKNKLAPPFGKAEVRNGRVRMEE